VPLHCISRRLDGVWLDDASYDIFERLYWLVIAGQRAV
jgi:hypothetical protein